MDYRREVDGLRALAAVPVILFHAGIPGFGGGFVGVDIFLVISGYLITSILLAEMEAGRFSLATFYERRARRILPALFVMMAVCIPFAWLWLRPGELKEFSQSLMAVSVFASNIFFWQESGYFATATELKPLLHTWSLAVEEQFYVLFPLLLMLTWRLGRKWMVALVAVIALESLAVAHVGAYNNPDRTFFLLPGRIWELAIGVLLAFHLTRPARPALPCRPQPPRGSAWPASRSSRSALPPIARPRPYPASTRWYPPWAPPCSSCMHAPEPGPEPCSAAGYWSASD